MTRTDKKKKKGFTYTHECLKDGRPPLISQDEYTYAWKLKLASLYLNQWGFIWGRGNILGKIVKYLFYPSLMLISPPFSSFLPSQTAACTIYRKSGVDPWALPVTEGEGSPHHFSVLGVMHVFLLVQGY